MSGSNGSKRSKPTTRKKENTSSAIEPDEKTLPLAIGKLFELNDYNIEYSKKIHGAEVDIVATPKKQSIWLNYLYRSHHSICRQYQIWKGSN